MGFDIKYSFAFTALATQINETCAVAELLLNLKDWELVEAKVIEDNILNKSKLNTTKRILSEIKRRLYNLNQSELEILTLSSLEDKKVILLISIIKSYRFILDFIFEILIPKYNSLDYYLNNSDYINFYNEKKDIVPELQNISESTSKKIKQTLFTMLVQLGVISDLKELRIIKPFISNNIAQIIKEDNPAFLELFNY